MGTPPVFSLGNDYRNIAIRTSAVALTRKNRAIKRIGILKKTSDLDLKEGRNCFH